MKPVNLLPASEQPRAAAPVPEGSSRAVLAVLGVLLLAVGGYVFVKNQETDRRAAIAEATQEKQQADARVAALQAFGDFSQVKQTRMTSITDLATKRLDWERLMRETALVLPDKVWLTALNGGQVAAGADAGPAAGTPAAATAAPEIKLTGCAPTQKVVAETMVRLRNLKGAEDVSLQTSIRSTDAGASAASGAAPTEGTGCGKRYQFDATITLAASEQASPPKQQPRAPARLGGGA